MNRNQLLIAGYISLFTAFAFYHYESPNSTLGRFFNGMALGFFGRGMYLMYKAAKNGK